MSTVPEHPTRDDPVTAERSRRAGSTPTPRHPTDLLTVGDLDEPEFEHLLHLAASMSHGPNDGWAASFPGRMISGYLETPSPLARMSFSSAASRLGVTASWLRPDDLEPDSAESIADTARVLAASSAAIVVRTSAHAVVEQIAAASCVPVVNAGTDQHHPCQAVTDVFTLRQHLGDLTGMRLAYIGDGDSLARSLGEAAALSGMEIIIASPERLRRGAGEVSRADELAADHGHITVVDDPREAVADADAVYAGRWSPTVRDAGRGGPSASREHFRLTPELMADARRHAVVMRYPPEHSGPEAASTVVDGPGSVVWQQAANRLPVQEAILHSLIRDCWMPEQQ